MVLLTEALRIAWQRLDRCASSDLTRRRLRMMVCGVVRSRALCGVHDNGRDANFPSPVLRRTCATLLRAQCTMLRMTTCAMRWTR
jgi:hypothetical protein